MTYTMKPQPPGGMSSVGRVWAAGLAGTHAVMAWTMLFDYEQFSNVSSYQFALNWPAARWVWLAISLLICIAGTVGTVMNNRTAIIIAWGLVGPTHFTFALSLFIAGITYIGGLMWLLPGLASYCALILSSQGRLDEGF